MLCKVGPCTRSDLDDIIKLMPNSGINRIYVKDGIYHVYNRGAYKQNIFRQKSDYTYFLYLLKRTLVPPKNENFGQYTSEFGERLTPNMHDKISLMCFSLMPNHYHMILKQKDIEDMTTFMRKIFTSYAIYFNKKYDHSGTLFQGKYKAKLIDNDYYLMHLSRYIHLNIHEANLADLKDLEMYDFSSYKDYIGKRNLAFLKSNHILNLVATNKKVDKYIQYKNFVTKYKLKDSDKDLIPSFLGYEDEN